MEQVAPVTPEVTFDFDFYRFTGDGGAAHLGVPEIKKYPVSFRERMVFISM
jgi:hypothetical protein